MAKQIKIGYDKTPAPITKQFIQLVDIEGTLLFDDAGNPLVTEENAALTSLTLADNALSVHVNNNPLLPQGGEAVPVEEQFKESSSVSSSLLGVPRGEVQLSLFSDVATYGLDTENWDASDFFIEHDNDPYQWYQKSHPIYGPRSNVRFYEGSDEQALYLKAFPSQYTYPEGTKERKRTFPSNEFIKYMNFVALGRYLYDLFLGVDPIFARSNFLAPADAVPIKDGDTEEVITDFTFPTGEQSLIFNTSSTWFDVKYGREDIQDSFNAIERWTAFYDKIIARTDQYPKMPQDLIDLESDPSGRIALEGFKAFAQYNLIRAFCVSTDTRPGGNSNVEQYGILQSKRAFRYQPGRSSGFTFGARMVAGDDISQSQIAEWGCSNDTDEYMFQVKGSNFSIVRRSTVRMPDELLERQGLSVNDQKATQVTQTGLGSDSRLWETVIRRSSFNGDKLLGDGPSGYILSFEDVTMYKIEFSWYGAIGAKFYAYVPVENDEARWVLMHTFVIENGLGEPCLENPDFKFKYLIYTNDTKDVKEPMYLYKYGSSVYIDGGDEGTIRLSSKSIGSGKQFDNKTPILGILPKETLSNTKGEAKINFKKSFPSVISVTSDTFARIDFVEINGSPQGVHFNYSPCIDMNGRHPRSRRLIGKYDTQTSVGDLNRISLVQPSEFNNITTNAVRKFPEVKDTFFVDLRSTSEYDEVYINSSALIKTFDTLQVGDCLYFGNDSTEYKIKKFTNERPLQNVQVTGVSGQFSCEARLMRVGERFLVTGSLSGTATITGYSSPKTYQISSFTPNDDGEATAFVLTEVNGNALNTGAGTTAGLTIVTTDVTPYSSTNKTGLCLEQNFVQDSELVPSLTNVQANLTYVYNDRELYSHVIADGVYGIYVGENGDIFKRVHEGNNRNFYTLAEDIAEDTRKVDGSIFRIFDAKTNQQKYFEMNLSGYNTIVASDTGITKDRFKIHFLNPIGQNKENGGRQYAEFLIGVTPYKPASTDNRSDDDPEVKFLNESDEYVEYDRNAFPSVEFCHLDTDFDERDRIGLFERDQSYGHRLQVDPRLDGANLASENKLRGEDIGTISTVQGRVTTIGFQFIDVVPNQADENGTLRTKIRFPSGGVGPSDGTIIPGFSEIGINFAGIGSKFTSQVIYPDENDEVNTVPYMFAETSAFATLDALPSANRIIQTKVITLEDDWRATALDESGDLRFQSKLFEVTKAVSFDTQPLYPVFALGDNCRVNGIVIEEISEQNIVKCHTPTWITEDTSWNTHISLPSQPLTNSTNNPASFNGAQDLSACRYDEVLMNPLRPGNTLYSYYVGAGETVNINLDNIYARDRKDISRGAINNRAVFLTASKINSSDPDGTLLLTITSKEQ